MRLTQAITLLILSELLVRLARKNGAEHRREPEAASSTTRRVPGDITADLQVPPGADVPNLASSITVYQAAKRLRISVASVYTRIHEGQILGVKLHAKADCGLSCRCPIRIPVKQLSSAESGA